MSCIKAVKLKRVGLILALVFMLSLSTGLCPAFASNLEASLYEQVLPPAPSLTPTYSISGTVISDETAAVIAIQQKLVSLGYDTGGIDGIYGPKTREAVMLFQASRNLIVDGIIGPQTLAALGFYY